MPCRAASTVVRAASARGRQGFGHGGGGSIELGRVRIERDTGARRARGAWFREKGEGEGTALMAALPSPFTLVIQLRVGICFQARLRGEGGEGRHVR